MTRLIHGAILRPDVPNMKNFNEFATMADAPAWIPMRGKFITPSMS